MSLQHLANVLNTNANYSGPPTNTINCPAVWTGFVMSQCLAVSSTTSQTPSAGQFVNGVSVFTGSTGSLTVTTPSATDLYAYVTSYGAFPSFPATPGDAFEFMIVNKNTDAGGVTLVAGAGVTLTVGSAVVATLTSKRYRCAFTSPTALTIFG